MTANDAIRAAERAGPLAGLAVADLSIQDWCRLSAIPAGYRLAPPALDDHGGEIRRRLTSLREAGRG